ncbi:hypothetical protein [Agrobacterium sp. MS2]|uniref:hypothetical protein n=1 Tax=Agrobacterium sp. MS2 TaxID=1345498 RepID=UPI001877F3D0|nr:hypothetical protein [Agrobacterium sp. MS2]
MGDFAQLILTADSTGLQRGERALDSISSTAEQTERRVVKASDGMTRGLRSISSQSTYATQALRASSMQLSQIAQQTSATGNLLQSIAIQLPDLALAFGPLGILAGAAAGAALSYYSTLLDSGDDAEQTLADQADLIVRAAESWGEAVPALRAYVDELKKAKTTADLVAAMEAISKEKWSLARQEVQNLNIDLVALVGDLRAAGAEEASVIKLQRSHASAMMAARSNLGMPSALAGTVLFGIVILQIVERVLSLPKKGGGLYASSRAAPPVNCGSRGAGTTRAAPLSRSARSKAAFRAGLVKRLERRMLTVLRAMFDFPCYHVALLV